MQVVLDPDRVEPHAEHLNVFGFLEGELGQIHFVAQAPLGPHRAYERLDVLGHRFLAGDKFGAQPGGIVAFVASQPLPILAVAGKIDVGRIPEFRIAAGKELQRQAVPVESACDERAETCPCHVTSSESFRAELTGDSAENAAASTATSLRTASAGCSGEGSSRPRTGSSPRM